MNSLYRKVFLPAFPVAAAFWFAVPASATVLKGDCTLTKTRWQSVDSQPATTNSTAFIPVPAGKVSFKQSTPGCAIVFFTAESGGNAAASLVITALLDDNPVSNPGFAFYTGTSSVSANAMAFVFRNVSAGKHFVQMQYRTTNGTQPVELDNRSIVIQYQ